MSDVTLISEEAKRKLRLLLAARDAYDEKKAASTAAYKELEEIELDVFEMFNDAEYDGTISVPLGPPYGTVKFRTRETHYAKITNEDALLEWYEQRGMVDEVSAPNFVKKRLNQEVRDIIDNPSAVLPPGMTYTTDRGMTITRPK